MSQDLREPLLRSGLILILSISTVSLTGCFLISLTGEVISFTGKVATTAVKTTASLVGTTAKIGGGVVGHFAGRRKVRLEKEGDSYYVDTKLNGKEWVRLVLDTGATSVQISSRAARRAGIDYRKGESVVCTLADGSQVRARTVTIDKLKVGSVTVRDIPALVFETDHSAEGDGLLGMSFLSHFVFQIDTERDLLILKHKRNRE